MPDYLYSVRVYVDVNYVPRGTAGTNLLQNQSNIPGFAAGATPGNAPAAQTRRFQQNEMVLNAIATPPSAANIGAAMTQAATDIQAQLTGPVMAQIVAWATGGP